HYYGFICHLAPTSPWLSPCTTLSVSQTLRGQASPVTAPAPCKIAHPQSHYATDLVSGFALFCTLTPAYCRIRFAFAVSILLPMAAFRPHRWPMTPLPFGLSSPWSG